MQLEPSHCFSVGLTKDFLYANFKDVSNYQSAAQSDYLF